MELDRKRKRIDHLLDNRSFLRATGDKFRTGSRKIYLRLANTLVKFNAKHKINISLYCIGFKSCFPENCHHFQISFVSNRYNTVPEGKY